GPYIFRNPQAWKDAVSIEINVEDADKQIRSIIEQGTYKPIPNTTAQGYVRALPERNRPRATLLRPYLYPLSWIWRGLNHINKRFTNKFYADLPVISVGGISAGGSGKTEIAAWLAHNLKESVVLSRGYKRPKGGSDIRSQHLLGDELEMLRRRGIPVLSSPNKIAGLKAAQSSGYKRVIIDDGFQSFYIHRNMNILTIDANWPRARGEFPVGWGRESMRAIDRADLIWIHNWTSDCRLSFPKPTLYSWYRPIGWLHRGKRYPLEHKRGEAVAICGISNPTSFWTMLAQIPEIHIKEWVTYPNHAPLPKPPSGCVVTEKDAARLSPDADVWALRIKLVVSATPSEKPNAIC
ncbi:MAG: tetraacyldisaccharide 4'-kinase, partial [Myxococcota bacterium]|nr:tetraacyldisaccharide 4'-kinase [Myxococcota bacterium]